MNPQLQQFIIDNIKKAPLPVILVVLLYLYVNELMDNKQTHRNCIEEVRRKEEEISAYRASNRRDKEMLMEYALKIRDISLRQETDSVMRAQTEQNVNKILKK